MEWFYFEEGDYDKIQLKQLKIDLLNNERIKFIKSGMHFYSFIVTTDNNVYYLDHLNNNKKVNFSFGKIKLIESSSRITVVVNEENKIYVTTENAIFKELEIENLNLSIKLIRISSNTLYFVTENDFIYYCYKESETDLIKSCKNSLPLKMITNSVKIKDLQCGNNFVFLLDILGNVYKSGNYDQYEFVDFNFTKINLQFKVKQIICHNYEVILLNEYNELYGDGHNWYGSLGLNCCTTNNFTKIVIPSGIVIKNLYKTSELDCNIFITKDNQLYGTGECNDGIFGIPNKDCLFADLGGLLEVYYVNKFTLINFKTDKKYINLFGHGTRLIFVTSDYKLISDDCENTIEFDKFELKCLQTVEKCQLVDIALIFCN